jgi:hypothetical protein
MFTIDPHQLLSTWTNLPHLLMIYGASSAGNRAVKSLKRVLRTVPGLVSDFYSCILKCQVSRDQFLELRRIALEKRSLRLPM